MRHPLLISLCIAGSLGLSACEQRIDKDKVDRAFQEVDVVDESNLSDIMLTVADPNEAVSYFTRAVEDKPERIDLQRGLAKSMVRAKRHTEAVSAWKKVLQHADATKDDTVDLADAYIRNGQWKEAEETLNGVPPTHETFKRYRLEAMIADGNEEWKKADSFYEIAVGLTTRPGGVLNNWGYSKLSRGDYDEAERLFAEALKHDGSLFTAKNNMVLSRGAQGKYTLPVVPMDQVERAQLLHTLGLSAVKRGDVETGKGLLRDAIETHPQHFEAAVRSLRALEGG
ncbi:tetratricopeptide repeat protein [Lutimaribacter sp. EGI FJ00015]|uniref:Tetratricopeptide repeat protein n=1 Tax=Lutimaribacter degradans TaxID=2945989 RepID=A0ACC5ZR08_9RHOB|nr:tetratricopeptide repeat protein [Lutimaribacter sp. EGI FJ00013]MCM2560608.1 tetratricopeptide repeat protein [Lutimaribacter sp. EGI FJ00013]MCO0612449.1 tetratricopeptide repeat protein [Lutimaribacter sp. EGI FJ00015]MCO0634432.1 tetratricopeptide repeat protein [Lutimaribacter sp. EGI FJ00014]